MRLFVLLFGFGFFLAAYAAGPAAAQDESRFEADEIPARTDLPEPDETGVTTINWDHLLPEGEIARIEELFRMANGMGEISHFGGPMPQIGTFNVEAGLLGRTIRMPGYILPLEYQMSGTVQEFLLVPYFGACIHMPPPPPNQIVYVTSDEPVTIEQMWDPVWVIGELTSDRNINDLGDAAYTLRLVSHERYEF